MTMRVTILGCGSSGGVPRVGSGWGACDPSNPRNRRRRCSILVESNGVRVLVDTSPDLREQLLDAGVDQLDAVMFTHEHADHTHGIDDLRALVLHQGRRIDAWMDARTALYLENRFSYIFEQPVGSSYPPILNSKRYVEPMTKIVGTSGGTLDIVAIRVSHGHTPALGLRIGAVAYLPDVSALDEDAKSQLAGLDLLILDALRWTRHPSHISVSEALAIILDIKPKFAYLTNLHVDLDYQSLITQLPDLVMPAYDGLTITI